MSYIDLVNSKNPLAYWPLNEQSGSVAHCEVNSAQNGTYSNVTLGAQLGPFEEFMAPSFDGSTSLVNVYSTALNTAINNDVRQGSVMCWVRLPTVGHWVDVGNNASTFFYMGTTASGGFSERIIVQKPDVAGCPTGCPFIQSIWRAPGPMGVDTSIVMPWDDTIPDMPLDWFLFVFTWDGFASELKLWVNDELAGDEIDGCDCLWFNPLSSTKCCIGSFGTTPNSVMFGNLCHVALFPYVLSEEDVDDLANYIPAAPEVEATPFRIPVGTVNAGVQLGIFRPLIDPGVSYIPRGQYLCDLEFDGYGHEIRAEGGYQSAQVEVGGRPDLIDDWLERGLGRTLVTYNEAQDEIFVGVANEVVAQIGPLNYRRGPLMDVENRVWLTYTPILDASVNPPLTGSETETTIAEHAASQAAFGVLERVYSDGTELQELVEQSRDTILAEKAFPYSSGGLPISGEEMDIRLTINFLGFWALADRYYFDDATLGTVTIRDKILAVLAADANGVFSTDYTNIEENLTLAVAQEEENRSAQTILRELVSAGNSSFAGYTIGVYSEEKVHYRAAPAAALYAHHLGDEDLRITYEKGGGRVFPWNVRPAEWIFFPNHMVGRVIEGQPLKDDPRFLFIESVRFTAPWSIDINGVQVSELPQFLAQKGLGNLG